MSEMKTLYKELVDKRASLVSDLELIDSRLKILGEEKRSIIVKKINGENYYYLQWRTEKKVNSRFLGKALPGKIAETESEIQERNNLIKSKKEKTEIICMLEKSILAFEKCVRKESMLHDYSFEVFWKDELSARVSVTGSLIKVNRILKHPAKSIFASEKMTRPQLNEILALRCFEKGRADINEKLHAIGLTDYNPLEIVKRTHGVSYNDFIWIRFPGEVLTSKDVLVRE